MNDPLLFAYLRRKKREWTRRSEGLTQAEVDEFNAVLKEARKTPAGPATPPTGENTPSGAGIKPAGPLTAIVGAVAATSLFASIPKDEGYKLAAYRDVVGIPTICFGDTKNVRMGMVETSEGCMRRLESQLVAHAAPVMACSPRLKEEGRDNQRAAAVSLAYNIGVRAYCRSTVDRRFDEGRWREGCDAFLLWNKAGGRVIRGLTLRRQRERAHCLQGVT